MEKIGKHYRGHVEFTIPGDPVAQPRPRVTLRGSHAHAYTPASHPVGDFKSRAKLAARSVWGGSPSMYPIRVDVQFVMKRPKAKCWKTKPMPRYPHTKRPDRDNLDKALLDALTGIIWADDSQVFQGTIEKWVAAGDEQPHTLVKVWEKAI